MKPTRALAGIAALLLAVLSPAVVLAATPVANDDPGSDCWTVAPWGGSYPIVEDYRAQQPDVFFPGDQAMWFPFWGHCSLLRNDTDADGDPLTYELVTPPSHGQVLKVDDQWTGYKPDPDYSTRPGDVPGGSWLSDSFTYKACDATTCSAAATMRIWIAEINDPPTFTAGPSRITVDEDSGPYSSTWATDISPGPSSETYQSVHFERDGPAGYNGPSGLFTVLPSIAPDGTLTFTPAPDASGHAHVTFVAKDDGGGPASFPDWKNAGSPTAPDDTTDQVTFEIDVTPVVDPIVAVDDTYTLDEDSGAHYIDLMANDSNPDGGPVWITGVTQPTLGTVAIETGGVAYAPDANANGTDTFDYTLTGGSTATVTVHVTPVSEPADTVDPVVVAPAQRLLGQTIQARTTRTRLDWSATDTGSGIASYKLQVSTDGGSYKTISLPRPLSTTIDRTLTNSKTYRFRVRATDTAGNTSPYAYGPTIRAVRYSQENSNVAYVGAWKQTTSPKALGGSARHATATTKSATFTVSAHDVGWIATRTTSSGQAQVLVDGVLVKTVDLDQSSTSYRKLVFQQHFSTTGPHVLQIKPVGDGRIDIDGFVVLK